MTFNSYRHTAQELEQRIAQIIEKQSVNLNKNEALKTIFGVVDLTTLEATDNPTKIRAFCEKAMSYTKTRNDLSVAAICIYSPFLKQAKQLLSSTPIGLATVACAFPTGQLPFDLKIKEVAYCVAQGADEIDMVISRGTFLDGHYDEVFEEIKEVKKTCGKAHLKVILETGELGTVENIRKASEIAILGGADFIKTSTGKTLPAATPLAALIMIDTIKEYYQKTGIKIGFKPAGGISEPETALVYYMLIKEILGETWLNKKLFRIGASRLADKVFALLTEAQKQ